MKFNEKNRGSERVVVVVSSGKRMSYETEWVITQSDAKINNRKRKVIQGDHPVQIDPNELMRLHKSSLMKYLRR